MNRRISEVESVAQCRQLVILLINEYHDSVESVVETIRTLTFSELGIQSLLAAGCVRAIMILLIRMALSQAADGGSDKERDRITTMAADALWRLLDKDDKTSTPDESAATVAALLGCTGWHLGQQIGCILVGMLLKEHHNACVSILPQLEKIFMTPSTHQVQLAAKTALSILVFHDTNPPHKNPEKKKTNLASFLKNSTLLELLVDDHYSTEVDVDTVEGPSLVSSFSP